MANSTGDMTQDEVDDGIKRDLAAAVGSSSDTNPVRLTTAQASRILELLGGAPEGDDPRAAQVSSEGPAVGAHAAAKAEAPHAGVEEETEADDGSDEPSKGGKRRRR